MRRHSAAGAFSAADQSMGRGFFILSSSDDDTSQNVHRPHHAMQLSRISSVHRSDRSQARK